MIVQKVLDNGRVYTYSDQGYKILQKETNFIYCDAVDVNPCPYTYEETNELIPEPETTSDDILNILLGGEET